MVELKEVREALSRIRRYASKTPLVRSSALSEVCGARVSLKAENLQKTGSFKVRGALNFLLSMGEEELRRGVITGSSGNHGQALAYAARAVGSSAVVVVPEDASPAKTEAIEGYGGRVIRFGFTSSERIGKAMEIAEEEGRTFVHPFDDPRIVAGQGTVGLEILEDAPETEMILAPIGGGGLISGIAVAAKGLNPRVKVVGVEPEASNCAYQSLKAGRIVDVGLPRTIADGLRTSKPGELPFSIMSRYLDDVTLVSEEEIEKAVLFLLQRCKLLVEPSGAVTVAALLFGKVRARGKVVAVLSGGNVAKETLLNLLSAQA